MEKPFVKDVPDIFNLLSENSTNKMNLFKEYISFVDNLNFVCKNNLNWIIIAYLNIYSIINKSDCLAEKIKDDLDLLMISETKLDHSVPLGQFYIGEFSTPIRLDRNKEDTTPICRDEFI